MKNGERMHWVDMMRGFCMLAILYFHPEMYYAGSDVTPYAAYVDNVLAAFFFLSGYLFFKVSRRPVRYRLRRIWRTLVVPYFVFSLLFLVPKAVVHDASGQLWPMLLQVFTGQASWFVAALVVSEVLFLLVLRVWRGSLLSVALYGLLTLVVAAVFGNMRSPLCNDFNFWHVNEAMLGSFFMSLGYLCHAGESRVSLSGRSWCGVVALLVVLLVGTKWLVLSQGQQMIFGPIVVSSFPLFVADNVVALLFLLAVFRLLPPLQPLSWAGRRSLVLYFVCGGIPLLVARCFGLLGLGYGGRLSLLPVYVLVVLLASLVAALVYRYLPWLMGSRNS